jgi:hypothetical protein
VIKGNLFPPYIRNAVFQMSLLYVTFNEFFIDPVAAGITRFETLSG